MKSFALIGAAGYVAPRHMKAIKDTQNDLVAAMDPNDSVGIIDNYFPEAKFFTEFERFDRYIDKVRREDRAVDYVSICSPNYLHDAHCRFGLRSGADVICEKPLVLNPWNLDALQDMERKTGKSIYNILQLRLHESIISIKQKVDNSPQEKAYDVDLTYVTSRGAWYMSSWKGDNNKAGGIATNIGIHLYDMLTWIFGKVKNNVVHIHEAERAGGYLELEKARVRWFLSVKYDYIPQQYQEQGKRTYRSITVDGDEIEFSTGFTELHTHSYEHILEGKGYGTKEVKSAIEIVHDIRNGVPVGLQGDYHPLLKL